MKESELLIEKIEYLLKRQEVVVVGIDGRCGSGKTTYATELAQKYNAALIHMDDFYLPQSQKTTKRLNEPGGNVDYERVLKEVAGPIRAHEVIEYKKFLCEIQELDVQMVRVPLNRLYIIEGAYALHPVLSSFYDVKVFFTHNIQKQKERIVARNGLAGWERFRSMWIPLEEKYIDAFNLEESCEIVLDTTWLF